MCSKSRQRIFWDHSPLQHNRKVLIVWLSKRSIKHALLQPNTRDTLGHKALDTMVLSHGRSRTLLDMDNGVLKDTVGNAIALSRAELNIAGAEGTNTIAAEGEELSGHDRRGGEIVGIERAFPVGETTKVEAFAAQSVLELVEIFAMPWEKCAVKVNFGSFSLMDNDEVVVARNGGRIGGLELARENHQAFDREEEVG